MRKPTFLHERRLQAEGFCGIVGVDEVGCGALAGPVVACALILPVSSRIAQVDDSKALTSKMREQLYEVILERTGGYGVGQASSIEIDQIGIRKATLLAMRRAVEGVVGADFALVDAWTIPGIVIPQRGIIHGDALVKSIAAASIVAKVTRDRIMKELAVEYPQYGFEIHKGYGTRRHRQRLAIHGPCPAHRLSFAPCRSSRTCVGFHDGRLEIRN